MANDGYTTIRIRESSRQKLEKLGDGTGLTMSDIIEKVLSTIYGTTIDDITNIHRDAIAFSLQYYDLETKEMQFRDISFQELKMGKVGDKYCVAEPTNHCQYEIAEILFVDESSVFVRVSETVTGEEQNITVHDLIHIDLF